MFVLMALQMVKSGMPVILLNVLIKHVTQNIAITTVNLRYRQTYSIGRLMEPEYGISTYCEVFIRIRRIKYGSGGLLTSTVEKATDSGLGRGSIKIWINYRKCLNRLPEGRCIGMVIMRSMSRGFSRNEKEHAKDRKETFVVEEEECKVREERPLFLENGTDAQDGCWANNTCLVFGESVFDTMILEHYQVVPLHSTPTDLTQPTFFEALGFVKQRKPSQTLSNGSRASSRNNRSSERPVLSDASTGSCSLLSLPCTFSPSHDGLQ
jgi:hypothetical protein